MAKTVTRKKNPAAQAMAHRRAAKLSPERLSEIGREGAEARWKGHKKKQPVEKT